MNLIHIRENPILTAITLILVLTDATKRLAPKKITPIIPFKEVKLIKVLHFRYLCNLSNVFIYNKSHFYVKSGCQMFTTKLLSNILNSESQNNSLNAGLYINSVNYTLQMKKTQSP